MNWFNQWLVWAKDIKYLGHLALSDHMNGTGLEIIDDLSCNVLFMRISKEFIISNNTKIFEMQNFFISEESL